MFVLIVSIYTECALKCFYPDLLFQSVPVSFLFCSASAMTFALVACIWWRSYQSAEELYRAKLLGRSPSLHKSNYFVCFTGVTLCFIFKTLIQL